MTDPPSPILRCGERCQLVVSVSLLGVNPQNIRPVALVVRRVCAVVMVSRPLTLDSAKLLLSSGYIQKVSHLYL